MIQDNKISLEMMKKAEQAEIFKLPKNSLSNMFFYLMKEKKFGNNFIMSIWKIFSTWSQKIPSTRSKSDPAWRK